MCELRAAERFEGIEGWVQRRLSGVHLLRTGGRLRRGDVGAFLRELLRVALFLRLQLRRGDVRLMLRRLGRVLQGGHKTGCYSP